MRMLLIGLASLLVSCASTEVSTSPVEPTFPDDWIGSWAGTVQITSADGPEQSFPMRLDIAETEDPEQYGWTITYPGDDVREYSLLVRDADAGAYAIDEHNGIVLEARLIDGCLHTWFEVNGNLLVIQESLVDVGTEDEALMFELWSAGGEPAESGTADFTVRSYLPGAQQRGRLSRVSE